MLTVVLLPHPSGFAPSKTNQAPAPRRAHLTLEPLEVAIHRTYETQQTAGDISSAVISYGMLHEKPTGVGQDYDLERGVENQT